MIRPRLFARAACNLEVQLLGLDDIALFTQAAVEGKCPVQFLSALVTLVRQTHFEKRPRGVHALCTLWLPGVFVEPQLGVSSGIGRGVVACFELLCCVHHAGRRARPPQKAATFSSGAVQRATCAPTSAALGLVCVCVDRSLFAGRPLQYIWLGQTTGKAHKCFA